MYANGIGLARDDGAAATWCRQAAESGHGRAASVDVGNTTGIDNATILVTASVPPGTSVDYWLSNDGGGRWYLARPGVRFEFPAAGDDLRWKAELHSSSPVRSPRIDEIRILVDDADLDGEPDAGS